MVVDPGIGVEDQLDALLREHDLEPVAVLLTHGHIDHTFSVTPVCGARGIPAYIHPDDDVLLTDPMRGMSAGQHGDVRRAAGVDPPDRRRAAGPRRPAGARRAAHLHRLRARPHARLGHVPPPRRRGRRRGHRADRAVSGDVLFAGSIGRTDLPGGSWEQMQRSLAEVVLPLPDDAVVLPGHGPATTIGRERATNPYLQDLPSPPPARGL